MIDTVLHAAAEVALDSDRLVDMQRPSRGGLSSAIREAATVPAKWRRFAECVLRRETGGVLHNTQSREDAQNGSSSAAGRWQFLAPWQHGGSFMVRDRLVRFGIPAQQARDVRKYLGARPIHRWDGLWQDVLFVEAVDRGGWRHWSGGAGCNALVPR